MIRKEIKIVQSISKQVKTLKNYIRYRKKQQKSKLEKFILHDRTQERIRNRKIKKRF